MNEIDSVQDHGFSVGHYFGSESSFFSINTHTVIYTWITIAIIFALLIIARLSLRKKNSLGQFITLSFVRFFVDMASQSLPSFNFSHFAFIATTFCFVLACNIVSIIPWMEEPTTDLNTTLALGLCSFIYTQVASIKTDGLWKYIKGYFAPFFILLPLNIIGKLATVMSISFRLFGNIYGGSLITNLYFSAIKGRLLFEIIGLASGLNIVFFAFFGLFEGFLQAFVFAMLSLTYLSLALQGEGH
jgi:F0F1-type ATP synthase, subunit a